MSETTAGGLLWESLDDEGRKSQLIAMTKLAAERGQELAAARAECERLKKSENYWYERARAAGGGE